VIPGASHCASIFQQSAIALLSLAHAQAATSAAFCAWYDPAGTNNFPKGCNNGALGDTNDPSVLYATAGDAGAAAKPLTGSGSPFAKTTHNGQANGIADVNGSLWQCGLGVTSPGTSGTENVQILDGSLYVLKESVAMASLTGGWNGATDAWGNASHLATLYDAQSAFLPWGDSTAVARFGNGSNRVFHPAASGADWLRTNIGIQQDNDAMSAGGTNLFGNDQVWQNNRSNVFPLSGARWSDTSLAGVFARAWSIPRSLANINHGFRAARAFPAFGS
jgi:hypothetical protein